MNFNIDVILILSRLEFGRWEYQSADDIDGSGHNGQLAFYEGGGFTQNLRRKKSESMAVIQDLKQNLWIDRATRVVFADFTVYNANINLFCVVRYVASCRHPLRTPLYN